MHSRVLIIIVFLNFTFSLAHALTQQTVNDGRALPFASNAVPVDGKSNENTPLLVLENSLYPVATLNTNGELISYGLFWDFPFTPTAQKISPTGSLLWTKNIHGVPLARFNAESKDEVLELNPRLILPDKEGGAYFAFSYSEFVGRHHTAKLYRSYPHLQRVSALGDTLWGGKGVRLTYQSIGEYGGGEILSLNYTPGGEILVSWRWFSIDTLEQRELGTYIQKVDAVTGALKLGPNGEKILNTESVARSAGNQLYFFYEDSVLCLNKTGDKIWNLDLLSGINAQTRKIIAANDSGDVLILYENAGGIKGRLFDKNGQFVWRDLQILQGNVELLHNTPVVSWGNNKWLFTAGTIHCIDRTGTLLWGKSGVSLPDSGSLRRFAPIDTTSFYGLATPARSAPFDPINLILYKIDQDGRFLWGDSGVQVFEKVSPTFTPLLVDRTGAAFIVIDGEVLKEPAYRSRGTFVQKVDKNGNLGIITSVKVGYARPERKATINAYVYPSPFRSRTQIEVSTSNNSLISVQIFDITGRLVRGWRRMSNEKKLRFTWDGRSTTGLLQPNGMYFITARSGSRVVVQKVLLLR